MLSLLALVALTGCMESKLPEPQPPQQAAIELSHPKVCEFSERLAALPQQPLDTAELRYLNEQWRALNLNQRHFVQQEAQESRTVLSALNVGLAHESAELLAQATEITAEAYDQIEGLRRFSRDPDNMKVPDSITRTMVNRLSACCLNQLEGNATALVREEKDSALYNVGAIAYFINRDVNEILRNERSLDDYRQQLVNAQSALPAVQQVNTEGKWATCAAAP